MQVGVLVLICLIHSYLKVCYHHTIDHDHDDDDDDDDIYMIMIIYDNNFHLHLPFHLHLHLHLHLNIYSKILSRLILHLTLFSFRDFLWFCSVRWIQRFWWIGLFWIIGSDLVFPPLVNHPSPYLISFSHILFKNIANIGSFRKFVFVVVFVFVFVFAFLCLCICHHWCHSLSNEVYYVVEWDTWTQVVQNGWNRLDSWSPEYFGPFCLLN